MKVDEAKYSVAELVDWFKERSLIVNAEYQRGSGLWPSAAKSYFIDSILRDFPFPKVYFHERLDQVSKRPRREIVDGQQRIATIVEFAEGGFALGNNAREYSGCRLPDLSQELQGAFWSYTVSVDVIRNADRAAILQMFRRMNAFTLPLNAAEKRHSEFFGLFKDWVNSTLDEVGRVLTDWDVLTSRQIVRMADAEFVAELVLALREGAVSSSPSKLRSVYQDLNDSFPQADEYGSLIRSAFNAVIESLPELRGTYAVKAHVFFSLLCALIHNMVGLPGVQERTGLAPIGKFMVDSRSAVNGILALVRAHEEKEASRFERYVAAASEGGNRAAQRLERIAWLARALRGEVEV
jgi:hypothetical protein